MARVATDGKDSFYAERTRSRRINQVFRAIAQTRVQIDESTRSDEPFFREAGAGPGVVACAQAQYIESMAPAAGILCLRYHVLAADLLSAGNSPAWHADRAFTLHDEVAA
jgi:hypothetical protein